MARNSQTPAPAELFQRFHEAARHAVEIGRIRGKHRKAVEDCRGANDEIESSERYASTERADQVGVDARDFKGRRAAGETT